MFNHNFRRRGIALWHIIMALATVGLLAALILPIYFSFQSGSTVPERNQSCQANLKQVMLSVKQYMQDYDEKFPLVETSAGSYGWADALLPYLKTIDLFQCPTERNTGQDEPIDPAKSQYTDYWFNARLAGASEAKLGNLSYLINLGDGNDGEDATNARYSLRGLPDKWRTGGSPLYRHDQGANLAFADGHVKWYSVKNWKNEVSNGSATFVPEK